MQDYTPELLVATLKVPTTNLAWNSTQEQTSTPGTQSTSTEHGAWWMPTGPPEES